MTIRRQDYEEENKITALWLYEFAYDLEKNAHNIDYLRDYLSKIHKNKKFDSIEEKLADIRERVGFNLTRKIVNEIEKISHEDDSSMKTSSKNIGSIKTAMDHSDKDIELMDNILTYIKDMIRHEPHLNSTIIIFRCKSEDGLRYRELESKIDKGKLVNYIKDLLKAQSSSHDSELAKYVPSDLNIESENDSVAEYYNHAESNNH